MNKKGIELGMNAVIIGILAIIVLSALIYIFTTNISKTQSQYTDISNKITDENSCSIIRGMFCANTAEDCANKNAKPVGELDCGTGKVCCEPT